MLLSKPKPTHLLAALLALAACRPDAPASALLILGFGERHGASRAFAPEELSISTINIDCAGPGGARASASSSDYRTVELELAPGAWVITAKGQNSDGSLVASGFLELTLGPAETLHRDILLSPQVGLGSIALSWTLAGELEGRLQIEGSLSAPSQDPLPISADIASGGSAAGSLRLEGLRSGSWTLELRLLCDGSQVCGLADAVTVGAGMETQVLVRLCPPQALLSLGFALPDYSAPDLSVEPALRLAASGTSLGFRSGAQGDFSWYAEGCLVGSGQGFLFAPMLAAGSPPRAFRIDCVQTGLPRSGKAEARVYPSQSLGSLDWKESIYKTEMSAAYQAGLRGLSDCRDLAWSADSSLLVAAGKEANALSLVEAAVPGSAYARFCLDSASAPALVSPALLRFINSAGQQRLVALSDSAGAAYELRLAAGPGKESLELASTLLDPCLAGARDAALPADLSCIYVAASDSDSIALLSLGPEGLSARKAASKGEANLSAFSRPYCLALNPAGTLLAVGTAGDDALYFFDRDASSNTLSYRSRLDKAAFPASAPLSDPCDLCFSPDGTSLYLLSCYGRAVIRLDLDAASARFVPVAGAKSGVNGVAGFAAPKRLGLSPDGSLLAVIGSGADDGLALFELGQPSSLRYVGCLLPAEGRAVPGKPSAIAFSPSGRVLALAADGCLSLFELKAH